jgi:radical SAM protein with 4Fe4S-binding SPASM domain
MTPRLQHLVIKPDLRCTARCPTCSQRRDLHSQARRQRLLTLQEWQDVLGEARQLGGRDLSISGGEPTLYGDLPALIRSGRQHGFLVQLNSNGSRMPASKIRTLAAAGLDRVMISLYSHEAHIHDAMRGLPGLWAKATAALSEWADLKSSQPGLEVIAQTLLCPENLLNLPDLLRLLKRLGADGVVLSYLEGNFEGTEVFSPQLLKRFDQGVRALLLGLCREWRWPASLWARRQVGRLFSVRQLPLEYWATGLYHRSQPACPKPFQTALILANGEVHPCSVVEYAHEPVMGNLFETSLTGIWLSDAWQAFRRHGHALCRRCPMLHQSFVPFGLPRWAVLRRRFGARLTPPAARRD